MVDKVREPKVAKSKVTSQGIEKLVIQAEKNMTSYDFPAALDIFDLALSELEQISSNNDRGKSKQLEMNYRIRNDRAKCYHQLAQVNLENN